MQKINYSEITPEIFSLADKCVENSNIDPELYKTHQVKRGLRDIDGRGVLTGLTEISTINSSKNVDGELIPCEGELYYRGININKIVDGFLSDDRPGFEETVYLLLFGELPDKGQLCDFNKLLAKYRSLPTNFVRDVIMKATNGDIMNLLARSILTLYSYDDNANDLSIPNVLRQCIQLIATFPMLTVYAYHAYNHYENNRGLYIHRPDPNLSTAENILRLLRPDKTFTHMEAKILDMALVLHAEHGGGNNSTFTTHVVTSSGTDTYSSVAASLCSLKGPKHGGANKKVMGMMKDIKKNVKDWKDDEEVRAYLEKIVDKQAYDNTGLIYGIGHAIYSKSDPRAEVFKGFVKELSEEKGLAKEYGLYSLVEELAPELIAKYRRIYKGVSPNVDFYSGFVYDMLGIPRELYTPMFAVARIVGWSAHRIEELICTDKIIRPAYMSVMEEK